MKNLLARAEGAIRFSVCAAPPVRHQLVIFPHAGGSSDFYRPWRDDLPGDVDLIVLEYPRASANDVTTGWHDPLAAIKCCMRGLGSLLGIAPVTVFGHSMGALLALHVAQTLMSSRFRVAQLILSSQMTPVSLQMVLQTEHDIDRLAEQAMALGEVSEPGSRKDDARTVLASVIRQDLALLQKLAKLPSGNLPTTRIFGGENDPLIDREKLNEWSAFLPQHPVPEIFPGGHFYYRGQVSSVLDAILKPHRSAVRFPSPN